MKNVDESTGKVLAGLRAVEATPALEKRMELRVLEAVRARGGSGWFGVWQWVGVGWVAMLLVGVGVDLRRQGRHDSLATNMGLGREARSQAGPDGIGTVQEGVSQRLKPGYRHGTAEAVSLSKAGSSRRAAMQRLTRVSEGANSSRDGGPSEIAGVPGAGFPAPPMPLTEQERLLLRVVQGGSVEPVAMLHATVQAMPDDDEAAAFLEFFGKPEEVSEKVQQDNQGESR